MQIRTSLFILSLFSAFCLGGFISASHAQVADIPVAVSSVQHVYVDNLPPLPVSNDPCGVTKPSIIQKGLCKTKQTQINVSE